MIHVLQIESFRFDSIFIETNNKYKPKKKLPFPPSSIEILVGLADHKKLKNHKSVILKAKINEEEEDFKQAPYRIHLEVGLELMVPPDLPVDKMYKAIEMSGVYLAITTLRANLATITHHFSWGEYILPCLEISKPQEGFKEIVDEHLKRDLEKIKLERDTKDKKKNLNS